MSNYNPNFKPEFKIVEEETYTVLPCVFFGGVERYIQDQNIPYTVLRGSQVPLEYDGSVEFMGHTWFGHTLCVKSHIDPESLRQAAIGASRQCDRPWRKPELRTFD